MLLVVVVTVASVQDRDGARLLVRQLPGYDKKLRKMWADSSYSGQLVDWVMVLPVVTCCNFSLASACLLLAALIILMKF